MPALILTVLPATTRRQRPFQTTLVLALAGFALRAIEGFCRPSWQHRSAVGVGTLSMTVKSAHIYQTELGLMHRIVTSLT